MSDSYPPVVIGIDQTQSALNQAMADHSWVEAATDRELWDALPKGRKPERIRVATLAVVAKLGDAWDNDRASLVEDPWFEAGFAGLFAERIDWTLSHVLQLDELGLSAAELALLITFPYLHQAFWIRQAAQMLQGTSPITAAFTEKDRNLSFARFAAEHGALYRRGAQAAKTGDPAANTIGWWLFHRWLAQQSNCYTSANIASLLPGTTNSSLNSTLTPARLTELMRVVQIDPAFLRRTDRGTRLKPSVKIAGGTTFEQVMREQLLGYVLAFAHRTAIDPFTLPRVVADHVGIKDGLMPEEVLESIRTARWDGTRTRVLVASCTHPATAIALRAQVVAVGSVLTEIVQATEESPQLEPLKEMPAHVSADGVGMAAEDEAAPASAALGHRFRLADDRIQELLMGEQLYGSPELAVRELYQNALDACRYREARTTYLAKTRGRASSWNGRISFRQDVDENGHSILECADNGIGMSDRELVDVFSRAGIRFAEMPEYVEEQADWAAQGIESYPNSRFGIGVLSYFMLADEITVTTCRLDREGNPGRRLEVHIAGPGALFRVRDLGAGDEAGTVVRLWLRPADAALHCTDLLRRILWVSDYQVFSEDISGRQKWEPRRLSHLAPIGSDALDADARRTAVQVVPTDEGVVWWCDTKGAVLADGIWAGTSLFGAVVNLTGRDLPRLTIDRRTIIDLDRPRVQSLLHAAVPALLKNARSPLSPRWLSTLVHDMPRLADEICERAIEVRYRPWQIADVEMPIEIVGCFPHDEATSRLERWSAPTWSHRVGSWRLAAWLKASSQPSPLDLPDTVVPARPSDGLLFKFGDHSSDWIPDSKLLEIGDIVLGALRTQRSPAQVLQRFEELGYAGPRLEELPSEVRATDPLLLSMFRNRKPPWLTKGRAVPHDHVILVAATSELSPGAVTERLEEFGFSVPTADRLPAVVHPIDQALLLGAHAVCVLRVGEPVPVAHTMIVAATTGRTPAVVARRLGELGYSTENLQRLPSDHDVHDEVLFSERALSYVRDPVPLLHITLAAIKTDRTPAVVAARLREAGYAVPPDADLPDHITRSDVEITKVPNLGERRFERMLDQGPVNLAHVVATAIRTGQSPNQVAQRLKELGFEPPSPDQLPETVDGDDMEMILALTGEGENVTPLSTDRISLRPETPLSQQHIMIAAAVTRRPPLTVARRLREMGLSTPPDALLEVPSDPDDALLLSAALNSKPPWLTADHEALTRAKLMLPRGHLLAAAAHSGKRPADIAARLKMLGLNTEAGGLPAAVDPLASQLLHRAVKLVWWQIFRRDQFLWLSAAAPVEAQHLLITAARTGLRPADIALRLAGLGFTVDDAQLLPASVDKRDLVLLSEDANGEEPFRSLDEKFPRGRILAVAARTGMSHRQVIDRTLRLGLTIGE